MADQDRHTYPGPCNCRSCAALHAMQTQRTTEYRRVGTPTAPRWTIQPTKNAGTR